MMGSSRKRGRQEMEAPEVVEPPKERSLVDRIRNMWEFANLAQWIFTFGTAVKLDENLDIEELEMELLKPHSTVLPDIGLALLKFVSSHRGLTPEIFDEYTRRQYLAKAPLRNPFGEDEEPAKFTEFDIFTKIRVLQQLTQWTMGNPDRIRERMEEQKDSEQTIWRIEPFGWDSDDRTYFVLDDNRLYRRTDPPPPPPPAPAWKPKKNSKKAKAALRASKRRKVSEPAESEAEHAEDAEEEKNTKVEKEDDGFGGMIWECLAITLHEYNLFTASIEKSRDPNEKAIRKRIIEDVLPLLEKQEETRKRKAAQKERELLNMEKLATAKRSSRIRGKVELQKQEEEAREAERKKQIEILMAKKEQEKWLKLEKERESRMQTREQRLKEREARRILHEEELANLSEDTKKIETGEGRLSQRHLKAEIEKKKQALEELAEEDDWIFDCICGAYGQIDDGTHSIACDKCNIWQHSKCVGVSQADADRDDFTFVCKTCVRRAEDAERAKTHPPIKIKLHHNKLGPSSPPAPAIGPASPAHRNPDTYTSPYQNGQTAGSPQVIVTPNSKNALPQLASWKTTSTQHPKTHNYASVQSPQSNGAKIVSQHLESTLPQASPSKYVGPYGPVSSPALAHPSSSHAFSPPHPSSPTNLPPTAQTQTQSLNGNSHISSPSTNTLQQIQVIMPSAAVNNKYSPGHVAPSPSVNQDHGVNSSINNGPRPGSSEGGHRRTSFHMPSPLASAPILTPSNKQTAAFFPPSSSPLGGVVTPLPPVKMSPLQETLPKHPGTYRAASIPPPSTGISPTKHSPPTSAAANGAPPTPSMLPPVASLSPSPSFQNLTPPVKPSDGAWNRANGEAHPQ